MKLKVLIGIIFLICYNFLEAKGLIEPKQYHTIEQPPILGNLIKIIGRVPNFIKQLFDKITLRETLHIVLRDKDGNIKLVR